jgi:hypothetical protein
LITEAARDGKFSETLVKQLLRQGEDRKTTVEETKLIELRIKQQAKQQKKQKEQLSRV